MNIWLSDKQSLHEPRGELYGGEFVRPFERPERIEFIVERLADRQFATPRQPGPCQQDELAAIHDPGYLSFLETAWSRWREAGFDGEAIASSYPARRMAAPHPPTAIDGLLGYYALASETAITAGTWEAALGACATAQVATQDVIDGADSVFALCRPPGHHAARDLFGGYCFINNAAVAARRLRASGHERVAVLDIDFHHGNGTQDIFYDDATVLFVSLHGDPDEAFPYYTGHADETGRGDALGTTLNIPMPAGTEYSQWCDALEHALDRIAEFGTQAIVISLGVDTFVDDPISFFRLQSDDFLDCGRRLARLALPTVVVMEGGYAIEAVGVNTVNVLEGFLDA